MVVDVEYAERYWYPDDGGQVWLAGYQLVDPDTGAYLGRDAPGLAQRGLRVSGVAGAQFRPGALESQALAPGSALELRREPENEHDPNAIAVHAGGGHVGFVPRELAAELARELARPAQRRDDAARPRGGDRAPGQVRKCADAVRAHECRVEHRRRRVGDLRVVTP
jgi:hypothetical protein